METLFIAAIVLVVFLILCKIVVGKTRSDDAEQVNQFLKDKRSSGDQDLGSTTLKLDIGEQQELRNLLKKRK